jgi:hypothetical protein
MQEKSIQILNSDENKKISPNFSPTLRGGAKQNAMCRMKIDILENPKCLKPHRQYESG